VNKFDAKSIAVTLGGEVTGPNQVSAPGPGHSKKDRSLSVKVAPGAPGGLLIHSFANDPYRICRDYVYSALGIDRDCTNFVQSPEAPPNTNSRTDAALRIWHEANDARATLAENYLRSRGLILPSEALSAIRFHHSCPFGPNVRCPCMVALFRDLNSNEPRAMLRTALDQNGNKIGRKVLGPKAGCAVKLSADADLSRGLTIGEGIETTIAGIVEGFSPAWAVGDAGSMARFPVLPNVKFLRILVDNDESGTGQASAEECSQRWTAAGVEVQRVVPTQVGADMADVVAAGGAAS
jgi:putative DNA primase/helicase